MGQELLEAGHRGPVDDVDVQEAVAVEVARGQGEAHLVALAVPAVAAEDHDLDAGHAGDDRIAVPFQDATRIGEIVRDYLTGKRGAELDNVVSASRR